MAQHGVELIVSDAHEGLKAARKAGFIFGRRFDNIFLIRSPAEGTITGRELDEERLYLYSKRYGIVGMTAGDSLAAYWLETDHGAFADED